MASRLKTLTLKTATGVATPYAKLRRNICKCSCAMSKANVRADRENRFQLTSIMACRGRNGAMPSQNLANSWQRIANPLLHEAKLKSCPPSPNSLRFALCSANCPQESLERAGLSQGGFRTARGVGESLLARKGTREFQTSRFCFGIFLPATRPRIARRNFSRSAGLSMSSLRFIASATVLA
jgi:hypothetical protein